MSESSKFIPKLDTDLITLRSLVAIADEKSFSAAAKKIGRTQSAVSIQVSKLEERIEAKLFDRSNRAVRPTEAGEELIAYARRILKLADEAMISISAPDTPEVLRLGFANYLAPAHLNVLLERFTNAHPEVDIKLHLGSSLDLHKELKEGNLDIIIAGPEYDGGQILVKEPLIWVGPKDYTPDESVSLVLMPPPCSYRKAAYDALTTQNMRFKVGLETNTIHGVQSAITAGLGVSIMARAAMTDDLQEIKNVYPELPKTSIVAYTAQDASQELVESFLTFLMERLESHDFDKH